jgi:ABC-type transporter Mla maintaining outer membrane lipid asymmetry ATPase subunit MlaF
MMATKETEKTAPPIQAKTLRKSFGKQNVLNGIDLEVAHGETLLVLGRSGMGKSVLLKMIIELQPPDSGSVLVHGQEISGLARPQLNEIRKKIGFLFQNSYNVAAMFSMKYMQSLQLKRKPKVKVGFQCGKS